MDNMQVFINKRKRMANSIHFHKYALFVLMSSVNIINIRALALLFMRDLLISLKTLTDVYAFSPYS